MAHLFGGMADSFTLDYTEWSEAKDENGNTEVKVKSPELLKMIHEAQSLDELNKLADENMSLISKDVELVKEIGKAKATFEI